MAKIDQFISQYDENLKLRIKNNFSRLTKSQSSVAKYLLEEYETCAFSTAAQLAEKIGVSEATIIRFVNTLKFNGYPDFQRTLQNIIKNKLTAVNKFNEGIKQIQKDSDIINQVWQTEMQNLSNTFQDISKETFQKVVDAILSARKVFIVGLRTSHSVALFLHLSLRYIHKETQLITPGIGDISEQIIFSSSKDLAFIIGFPRYAKQTLEVLKYIHQSKVKTVVLTDSLVSPLAQYADYIMIAHNRSTFFLGSLVGALGLVNALITVVSMKNRTRNLEALKEQEKIWEKFKILL